MREISLLSSSVASFLEMENVRGAERGRRHLIRFNFISLFDQSVVVRIVGWFWFSASNVPPQPLSLSLADDRSTRMRTVVIADKAAESLNGWKEDHVGVGSLLHCGDRDYQPLAVANFA